MRFNVRHPVLVDTITQRSKTRQKTVATTTTAIDIPVMKVGDGFAEVLTFDQDFPKTVLMDQAGRFFLPVCEGFGTVGKPISYVSQKEITAVISEYLVSHASELIENRDRDIDLVYPVPRKKGIMAQPDVEELAGKQIDLESYGATINSIHLAASDFAIIGKHLYRRIPEPYYVVGNERGLGVHLSLILNDEIPERAIAFFRLGKLAEAQKLLDGLIAGRSRLDTALNAPGLSETGECHADFDDVGLTIAVAATSIVEAFKMRFTTSRYDAHARWKELAFDFPIDQLILARELNELTAGRSLREIAKDADRLGEIIEAIVEQGEQSALYGLSRSNLDLVADLWANQTIDLALSRGPRL